MCEVHSFVEVLSGHSYGCVWLYVCECLAFYGPVWSYVCMVIWLYVWLMYGGSDSNICRGLSSVISTHRSMDVLYGLCA